VSLITVRLSKAAALCPRSARSPRSHSRPANPDCFSSYAWVRRTDRSITGCRLRVGEKSATPSLGLDLVWLAADDLVELGGYLCRGRPPTPNYIGLRCHGTCSRSLLVRPSASPAQLRQVVRRACIDFVLDRMCWTRAQRTESASLPEHESRTAPLLAALHRGADWLALAKACAEAAGAPWKRQSRSRICCSRCY